MARHGRLLRASKVLAFVVSSSPALASDSSEGTVPMPLRPHPQRRQELEVGGRFEYHKHIAHDGHIERPKDRTNDGGRPATAAVATDEAFSIHWNDEENHKERGKNVPDLVGKQTTGSTIARQHLDVPPPPPLRPTAEVEPDVGTAIGRTPEGYVIYSQRDSDGDDEEEGLQRQRGPSDATRLPPSATDHDPVESQFGGSDRPKGTIGVFLPQEYGEWIPDGKGGWDYVGDEGVIRQKGDNDGENADYETRGPLGWLTPGDFLVECDGVRVNLNTNLDHCGSCRNACRAVGEDEERRGLGGEVECVGGECKFVYDLIVMGRESFPGMEIA